jgi:hypothetical protein
MNANYETLLQANRDLHKTENGHVAINVPEAGNCTIVMYDALGRYVQTLLDHEVQKGTLRLEFTKNVEYGGYFIVIATRNSLQVKPIVIVEKETVH